MKIRMKNGRTYRVSKSQGRALIAAKMGKAVEPRKVERIVHVEGLKPSAALDADRVIEMMQVDPEASESIQPEIPEELEISPRTGKPKRQYKRREKDTT